MPMKPSKMAMSKVMKGVEQTAANMGLMKAINSVGAALGNPSKRDEMARKRTFEAQKTIEALKGGAAGSPSDKDMQLMKNKLGKN